MRFCMLSTFYPPYHHGGDGTYLRALSVALVQRGHEVCVVHCEDACRLGASESALAAALSAPAASSASGGVRVVRLKSRLGLLSPLITQQTGRPGLKSKRLRQVLAEDFDVVHFHNISLLGGPGVIGLSRAPVNLYTLHEHWLICPTHILWKNKSHACEKEECFSCSLRSGIPPQLWRQTGLLRRNLGKIDRFLSPSRFTAERHRAAGIQGEIEVLPLFSNLDPEEYADESQGRMSFVTLGRLSASKGIDVLVESFCKWPEFELHVVGDGEQLPELRRRYAGHEQIHFHGKLPQSELVPLYRRAAALILPSLAPETFGLTVVEAFACGVPAIVRIAGGNREAIDASGAGYLYRSEAELHELLQRFQADPSLRGSLGAKARAAFEELYTKERHVDAYLELIEGLQRAKGLRPGESAHAS